MSIGSACGCTTASVARLQAMLLGCWGGIMNAFCPHLLCRAQDAHFGAYPSPATASAACSLKPTMRKCGISYRSF